MHGDGSFGGVGPGGGVVAWACRQALIWGGVSLVLYLVASNRGMFVPHEVATNTAAAPAARSVSPGGAVRNSLVHRADRQGHVVLDATVNGAKVRFLVDTGATLVALTPEAAAAAGISRGDLAYKVTLNTANGQIRAAPVTLRGIRIGQLWLDDVKAVVVDNLATSLLGMSFLSRLESWEMRDGMLTMTW